MVASFLRAEPGATKWKCLVAYIVGHFAAESCQGNFALLHYKNVFLVGVKLDRFIAFGGESEMTGRSAEEAITKLERGNNSEAIHKACQETIEVDRNRSSI